MKDATRIFFIVIRDFLTVYLPKQRCTSSNTIKSYRDTLNLYIDFILKHKSVALDNISFNECTHKNISDFLDWIQSDRGCSGSTRNQRLFALKSFFKYAGTQYPEWLSIRIETEKVAIQKKETKLIDIIPEDALKCILEQPNPDTKCGMRNLCFMVLMYDTASRDREMLDLTLSSLQINQKNPTICITRKGNKTRMVPIMEKSVQHLKKYLLNFHPKETRLNEDYLFYTYSHGEKHQMSDDNVVKFLTKYGRMAKTECISVPDKITPHMFRHARAIHLYRSGMPLTLLSEFLGHAGVQTTTIYAYADTEMKRSAIEKATNKSTFPKVDIDKPAWQNDDELIKKLYGLK